MGTCYAETFVTLGKGAQYLSTLLNLETVLAEVLELLMIGRDGWGVDNQTRLFLLAHVRNLVDTFMVMDKHTLVLEVLGQVGWGLVVTSYHQAFLNKVTGDGTHSNATGAYKIYCFYIV
jgi:hypothetical protein